MRPCTVVVQLCPCGYEQCKEHYYSAMVSLAGGVYLGVDLAAEEDLELRQRCANSSRQWLTNEVDASRGMLERVT